MQGLAWEDFDELKNLNDVNNCPKLNQGSPVHTLNLLETTGTGTHEAHTTEVPCY